VPALYNSEHLVEALSVAASLPSDEVLSKLTKGDVKRQFRFISMVNEKSPPNGLNVGSASRRGVNISVGPILSQTGIASECPQRMERGHPIV
jgi:hypothetical protein